MATRRRGWLGTIVGPWIVRLLGEEFPQRPAIEFVATAGTSIEVEDLPDTETTRVTLGGSAVPGGAVGSVQFHGVDGEDPIFAGSDVIVEDDGSFKFTRAAGSSFPISDWRPGSTSNASATSIASIALPSDIGDCQVSVHAESTYRYATGGGTRVAKASFKRVSGTLTRVGIEDLTIASMNWGTAVGGHDIAKTSDTVIDVKGTGIAATDIAWITSLHIQVARLPS